MAAREQKLCPKCREQFPLGSFGKNRSRADGLQAWCKTCQKKVHQTYLSTKAGKARQREALVRYRRSEKGRSAQRAARQSFRKTLPGKFEILRARARRRGVVLGFSAGEFETWHKQTPDICHYCHRSGERYRAIAGALVSYLGDSRVVSQLAKKIRKMPAIANYGLTLDRIRNDLGYSPGNLVKACWFCNLVKGSFLEADEASGPCQRIVDLLEASTRTE